MSAPIPSWVDEVLQFWFVEVPDADKWKVSAALDADIHRRFSTLHTSLSVEHPPQVETDARTALATVIVFDQFSRNMFRGTPAAFASDSAVLTLAERAIAKHFDQAVVPAQRLFFYLPFEHAEDAAMQDRAVLLIGSLNDAGLLDYAVRHRDVIRRFGRFPHRNAILGRTSTPEELAYLAEPGSGF